MKYVANSTANHSNVISFLGFGQLRMQLHYIPSLAAPSPLSLHNSISSHGPLTEGNHTFSFIRGWLAGWKVGWTVAGRKEDPHRHSENLSVSWGFTKIFRNRGKNVKEEEKCESFPRSTAKDHHSSGSEVAVWFCSESAMEGDGEGSRKLVPMTEGGRAQRQWVERNRKVWGVLSSKKRLKGKKLIKHKQKEGWQKEGSWKK